MEKPGHAKLTRSLSAFHVFSIASGGMISSGLFVLPGIAYAVAGPGILLSYLAAGLLSLPGMLSLAELTSAMPRAGGDSFAVVRSMGPAVGTVAGLASWFALAIKSAFALVGAALFTELLVAVDARLIALAFCLLFLGLNLVGIGHVGRVVTALTVVLIVVLAAYVGVGFTRVRAGNFAPFFPSGVPAVFSATGLLFISYAGFLKIASVAEEVKNPVRNIPLGMAASLVVMLVLNLSVVFVTVGALDPRSLSGNLRPLSEAAGVFAGAAGPVILGLAAVISFFSTANAGLMASARSLVPLARDHLVPRPFARVGRRFHTPFVALVFTAAAVAGAVFLGLELLVEAASLALILANIFASVSVLILRISRLQNYHPRFRAPLFPWLQIAGVVLLALLVVQMGWRSLVIAGGFVIVGGGIYLFFGRIRGYREYALLHLVENLTARELTSRSLENELKDILIERDDISKDRFDELVENAVVIDGEEPQDKEDFFREASARLARELKLPADKIFSLLQKREKEGSTGITPFWAVPHIIIPGKNKFHLLIARNRAGITFTSDCGAIRCAFILIGTKDERNFHLRALSSIAQIIQDPKFEKTWLAAKRPDDLRDIVLLGKRLR